MPSNLSPNMPITRHLPIAEQVTKMLHQRILDSTYLPGERLPSEAELADELGVSRGTTRTALASLASAGLITRKQGDGTYVRQLDSSENSLMHAIWEFSRLIEASGRQPSICTLSVEKKIAVPDENTALELDPHDQEVFSVERLICADGKPIIYSTNISPFSIFLEIPGKMDARLGLHEFLKRYCNQEIARVDVSISPTMAPDNVRETLSLERNRPILRIEEIFRDINRKPLVFAVNYHSDQKLSLLDIRPWHSYG
jgi:DNA-binding GntR family transcriptional regulator